MSHSLSPTPKPTSNPPPAWVETVIRKAQALRYGSIQITIHDGRITQIESTEKTRFSDPPNPY